MKIHPDLLKNLADDFDRLRERNDKVIDGDPLVGRVIDAARDIVRRRYDQIAEPKDHDPRP